MLSRLLARPLRGLRARGFASASSVQLPPLQTGPAAWIGEEMRKNTAGWTLQLTRDQIAELERAAAPFVKRGGTLNVIQASEFPLPTFGAVLRDLRKELLHGKGFCLVRGLNLQHYSSLESAAIFLGLGSHLGSPRSQNAKGHLLGHVKDLGVSGSNPNVRYFQTKERQTFHTDSCDVVGLLCLRNAMRGGDSLLVSALSVFNVLRREHPALLARLLQPMPHDRRGEVPAGQKPWFDIPVFSELDGQITVFYQRQYFDSAQRFPEARRLTPEDVAALDKFDAVANDPRLTLPMRLESGDMQFVYNHNMLHDRTAFEDYHEPERKRHLLRLWLTCPGDRRLPESFKPRYGSITVGDRGGVVVPGTKLHVALDPQSTA